MQERRVRQGTHQRSLSPALRHLTYSSNNTRWWTQRMYPSTMPTSSLLSLFSIQFLSFRRTSPFHKAYRCLQPHPRTPILLTHTSPPLQVLAASGLVKRDLFSLPNPFAVITTDGTDLRQTTVFKRTLTPYWNETFELLRALSLPLFFLTPSFSLQLCQRFLKNLNSSL